MIADGKEILKYEKINLGQFSFYSLDGDEILMYKYENNQTQNLTTDDYFTLNFLTVKKKIQSSDFSLFSSMSMKKAMQKMVKLLLKEKVLDTNGAINIAKLDAFYEKYNQEIK